jgi:hypothetical protein
VSALTPSPRKRACPACGAEAFSLGACSRCGYSSGEENRCPHCNAVARVDGSGAQAVCAVCGGPRIPGGYGGRKAIAALREQQGHIGAARLASFATMVQGIFATFVTLIGLAVHPQSLLAKGIVFAVAVVPLLLALRSRARATAERARAKDAGERAWQHAAEDAASRGADGITVPVLAETLGIDAKEADRLLTSLAVHERTRVDVGDDAEVRYSVAPEHQLLASAESELESELADEPRDQAAAKEPTR